MRQESQNTEYKEQWKDEYLAWVAGFANAKGGTIIIGKSDKGTSVGVPNSKKLLEDLPNKINSHLGIQVAVNLITELEKQLIEIIVAPHPIFPVAYKSRYYQRIGSTNQELKGAALTNFLLLKQGLTFDGVSIPSLGIDKLSLPAIESFKQLALQSGSLTSSEMNLSVSELLDKLLLLDNAQEPKRAAFLLFTNEPQRYVSGSFIQFAFFEAFEIIKFKDELHSDIIQQATSAISLLKAKYLKASVSFNGLQRLERFPIPDEALRESIINAIVHKNYAVPDPIHITVTSNKLTIWNPGELPDGWTISENLLATHPSNRRNPNIANVFTKAGFIESWGRGITRIVESCKHHGNVGVSFHVVNGGFQVSFAFIDIEDEVIADTSREMLASEPSTSRETADTSKEIAYTSREMLAFEPDTSRESAALAQSTSKETTDTSRETILQALSTNENFTAKLIAEQLGITEKGVRYHLDKLKAEGIIKREGSTKKPIWRLLKRI
ncbi:MAG: ATP-binding protein [Flexibacteraceae bacterium]